MSEAHTVQQQIGEVDTNILKEGQSVAMDLILSDSDTNALSQTISDDTGTHNSAAELGAKPNNRASGVSSMGHEPAIATNKQKLRQSDLTPFPITETANPCQKKKFSAVPPKAPVKRKSKLQEFKRTISAATNKPPARRTKQSTNLSAGMTSTDDPQIGKTQVNASRKISSNTLALCAQRISIVPSVTNVINFRKVFPPQAKASDVSEALQQRFSWVEYPVVNTQEYVKGIMVAVEHERRKWMDDVGKFLKKNPSTEHEAATCYDEAKKWFHLQYRPNTPTTEFEEFEVCD